MNFKNFFSLKHLKSEVQTHTHTQYLIEIIPIFQLNSCQIVSSLWFHQYCFIRISYLEDKMIR